MTDDDRRSDRAAARVRGTADDATVPPLPSTGNFGPVDAAPGPSLAEYLLTLGDAVPTLGTQTCAESARQAETRRRR